MERRVRAVEFIARNDIEFRDKVRQPPEFPLPGSNAEADEFAREARKLLGAQPDEPLNDLGRKTVRAGLLHDPRHCGTRGAHEDQARQHLGRQ
ncbi:hypothetical protein GCM10027590_25860 [Nocardiopsis nanhaiensis]